jgi:hypothetical protein
LRVTSGGGGVYVICIIMQARRVFLTLAEFTPPAVCLLIVRFIPFQREFVKGFLGKMPLFVKFWLIFVGEVSTALKQVSLGFA